MENLIIAMTNDCRFLAVTRLLLTLASGSLLNYSQAGNAGSNEQPVRVVANQTSMVTKQADADNGLLLIDNGTVRVGIDRAKGGAITWLSAGAYPKNMVNLADPGRLIQQSYYAGKSIDRTADGQSQEWSPWPWNPIHVSERSKPASRERMKTSHFEEHIALSAVETAQERDESTQHELATFNNDLGGAWLVSPAHCAGTGHSPRDGGTTFTLGRFKAGQSAHRL